MEMQEIIKNRRKELKMTLEDVAEKVGVQRSTVHKWESGVINNMRRDKIAKLAEALRVSPGYIMGLSDESGQPEETTEWAADLADDEKLLITIYRSLNPAKKNYLIRQIEGLLSI